MVLGVLHFELPKKFYSLVVLARRRNLGLGEALPPSEQAAEKAQC